METLTPAMAIALRARSPLVPDTIRRDPIILYEFYPPAYAPVENGLFDPAQAVALYSETSIIWLGHEYIRKVLNRSEIGKHITADFNGCELTFNNAGQYMTQFTVDNKVEGMRLVIRYIDREVIPALENSLTLYVGKLAQVDSITDEEAIFQSKEEIASTAHEMPRRLYSPDDPYGRSPNDPEFEGIRFKPHTGSFLAPSQVIQAPSLLNILTFGLFGKKKKKFDNIQFSSEENIHAGDVMRNVFGRVHALLTPVVWEDAGIQVIGLYVAAGHKVWSLSDPKIESEGYRLVSAGTPRLGDKGGTGTNNNIDPRFSIGYLSRTAYNDYVFDTGPSGLTTVSGPPQLSAWILGELDLPGALGSFDQKGTSDNPFLIWRFVMTHPDYGGLPASSIHNLETIKAAGLADGFIRDRSNGNEAIMTADGVAAIAAGTLIRRRATGFVSPIYLRWARDHGSIDPFLEPIIDPWEFEIDTVPATIAPVTRYVRRATYNASLEEVVSVVDFLYNNLFPTCAGFMIIGQDGRYRPGMERPADNTFLRAATAIAGTIPVWDIYLWKQSLVGLALIGSGLSTGETREITSVEYEGGDAITLVAASTGVTLTRSGPTLTGGTSLVPSSGYFDVSGGPPIAGHQVVATIDGVAIPYTLVASDDLSTAAEMLAMAINADPELSQFVRADYDHAAFPQRVTVYSKQGRLLFADNLINVHRAQLDNPLETPAITVTDGGVLQPGTYYIAYSLQTAVGETAISPVQAIVVAVANKRLNVPILVLPAGADSFNWYMSGGPDDHELKFVHNGPGSSFILTTLPLPGSRSAPERNDAGEEVIRIAASFTAASIRSKLSWPNTKDSKAINQILIKYQNAADGYREHQLFVNDFEHQREIGKTNKEEISGRGVEDFNQAFRMANLALAKFRDGNMTFEWDTGPEGLPMQVGIDVVAVSDASGLVNQPVRLEHWRFQPNNDVILSGRIYSTNMYSDQVGQKKISLASPLKFTNSAPPLVETVTLSEGHLTSASQAWISTIIGSFGFAAFPNTQSAHIYIKYFGAAEYVLVDSVRPDSFGTGRFEIAGPARTTPGNPHLVKIVTMGPTGKTLGLTAAIAYPIYVTGPPAMNIPTGFTPFWNSQGDLTIEWIKGNDVDSASQEKYEMQLLAEDNVTLLRPSVFIKPTDNRNSTEYVPWTIVAPVTAAGLGSIDLNGGTSTSQTAAEIVGGLLFQVEAAPLASLAWQAMPNFLSLYPEDTYGYNAAQAIMWQFMDRSGAPEYNSTQHWWAYPGGFSGGDHDAFRRPMIGGNSYDILIRADGRAEFHINYGPTSKPIYVSEIPIDVTKRYKVFAGLNSIGYLRKARWTRFGPEWTYIATAQRLDRGVNTVTGALPANIRVRVRQLSPWTNGTNSAWVYTNFIRP